MAVAFLSARRSKDPNKQVRQRVESSALCLKRHKKKALLTFRVQVGACIVGADKVILGIGYNGFPRGCADDKACTCFCNICRIMYKLLWSSGEPTDALKGCLRSGSCPGHGKPALATRLTRSAPAWPPPCTCAAAAVCSRQFAPMLCEPLAIGAYCFIHEHAPALRWTAQQQLCCRTRYPYVCHAELNAILNKNVASLNGAVRNISTPHAHTPVVVKVCAAAQLGTAHTSLRSATSGRRQNAWHAHLRSATSSLSSARRRRST